MSRKYTEAEMIDAGLTQEDIKFVEILRTAVGSDLPPLSDNSRRAFSQLLSAMEEIELVELMDSDGLNSEEDEK